MEWAWAIVLKPFVVFVYALIVRFVEVAVSKWAPERVRRVLLRKF